MYDPLRKLLAGLTLLAFGAVAAGAADYAEVDSEGRAEPRLVIVDTSIPQQTESGLDTIIQRTIPTSAAKSFTYSMEEEKLVSQPALTDPKYTTPEQKTSEKKTEAKKEEKKGSWFSRNWYWAVPTAAAVVFELADGLSDGEWFDFNFKKKDSVVQTGKVNATVSLVDSLTGQSLTGGTIKYVYGGTTVSGSPGQSVYITDITKGTSINVQITATADNHVQRKIIQASMAEGDNAYTINLAPVSESITIDGANYTFDYNTFVNEITGDNIINRLKPPTSGELNVYFNPDEKGTGKRLPDNIVNELINVWDWIKNHSNGEITNIVYHKDGTKAPNAEVGAGEVYIYETTNGPTAASAMKLNSDNSVYGIYITFNSSNLLESGTNPILWTESFDSMNAREINLSVDKWKPLYLMEFKRIAGNNNSYKIDLSHEEQLLPDKYSGTVSSSSMLNKFANAYSQFNTALRQGNLNPIDLRKRIMLNQKSSLDLSLSPEGKINLAGNYDLGNGKIMLATDLTGKNLVIGADKRIGQQYFAVIYDSQSGKTTLNSTFALPGGISLAGGIDNIMQPKVVPLSLSYAKNNISVSGAVDNALNINYAAGQASFSTDNITGAVNYIYNKLGPDMIGAGIAYNMGKYMLTGNISKSNNMTAFDIGFLAKTFSILEKKASFSINAGIDQKGNKRIYAGLGAAGF